MKRRNLTLLLGSLIPAFSGCTSEAPANAPIAVAVTSAVDTEARADDPSDARARRAVEVSADATPQTGAAESEWLPRLRRVCEDIDDPKEQAKRETEGWEGWKEKLAVRVVDFNLYSPTFKTWSLAAVDDPAKSTAVRHAGPFYGVGLTVEVENSSDTVVQGDDIYVWTTLKTKAGEHLCFADAKVARSWDPFAKKGVGGFVTEKSYPEWPFRPKEKKRYAAYQPDCFTAVDLEGGPVSVKVEVFARFRPVGGKVVIAGPLATFERSGDELRGAPLATAGADDVLRGKTPTNVTVWAAAAHQVLVSDGKKFFWTAAASLGSASPERPIATSAVPETTPEYSQVFGSTTVSIKDFAAAGWRTLNGTVALGHKVVTAQVSLSVDSSAFQKTMDAAVTDAQAAATAAASTVAVKQAELDAAKTILTSSAGSESEATAKESVATATTALADATKAQKAADGAVTAATKALASGLAGFLKAQAAQVDCGSFLLDVGRAQLKPRKGSFGAAACKALVAGTPVTGALSFDLERWDAPVALIWKGSVGPQAHVVLSHALGDVLAD
jgi:hypothetical protein